MRTQPARTCVLVSGGLDSALLLHTLLRRGHRLAPLYLRGGLRWERAELHWLRRFLHVVRSPRVAPLSVVEMPLRSLYGAHWSLTGRRVPGAASPDAAVYLPGRNLLLLSAAAIMAVRQRATTVALGSLSANPFPDAAPAFFRGMAASVSRALGRPLRIAAPLRRATKFQLIRAAGAIPLHLTFSCLRPQGLRHCGRCNKCAERRRAFARAGRTDPTDYAR